MTVALSVTWTEPVPIETLAAVGVVCTVVSHSPKLPRMKSFSVAVGDVDARVSDATDAKHRPVRPRPDRLTPPSKNSPLSAPLFGVPLLSVNDHGIVIVPALTMPQNVSGVGLAQFAFVEVALRRRFVAPH